MVKSTMLPFTTLEKKIREDLRYNVKVGLFDGGFFGLALGFASFGTILPLFVASMTDSATLIGLVPAIQCYGDCSDAWGFYINESLRSLITTGKGHSSEQEQQSQAA